MTLSLFYFRGTPSESCFCFTCLWYQALSTNMSVRWVLLLCPSPGRAAVSAAREKKLEYRAEQQSSSPPRSTPITTEQSQHQSQLSCFNLLDWSCKDPVCPTGLTLPSNLHLCPSGQRGSVRAVDGYLLTFSSHRLLCFYISFFLCHASSICLSHFVFNLPVYHSAAHTVMHIIITGRR